MLEVGKIWKQIHEFAREQAESATGLAEQHATASRQMCTFKSDWDHMQRKIGNARTSWLVADFQEKASETFTAHGVPMPHAVGAADGSQIMPNKHEIAMCYLINTGSYILNYGNDTRPQHRSNPEIFYRDEDIYEKRDGELTNITPKRIAAVRTLAESHELQYVVERLHSAGVPSLALFDGTLIWWWLSVEKDDFRNETLTPFLEMLADAKEHGIPVAGFISDPRSRDVVNAMRISLCPSDDVRCETDCPEKDKPPEDRSCAAVARLTDGLLFQRLLEPGQRSALFASKSDILGYYGEHRILVFYLNVGKEIARVEVPEWVANDPNMLDQVHAICYDQACKGSGYPVSLAYAHHYAVVRGDERILFYEEIERAFNKYGAKVSLSRKQAAKQR